MIDFFAKAVSFFNDIILFLSSGIYDFIVSSLAKFIIAAQISFVKFKIYSLGFAWDVAKEIINQLNLSSYINSAFNALDNKLVSMMNFFKIPEAINILMSARITRFVLNFLGL